MTFDEYVATHLDRLIRFAAVLTGDQVLAEDILQNVLARACDQWARVSAAGSPHAYVRRMVVNEHLSWRRKWQRITLRAELDDLLPVTPDHADAHAQAVVLLGLVQQLPARQRTAIVLRFYEELDDTEIAATLGCDPSTVRSNIARALASLRVSSPSALEAEI